MHFISEATKQPSNTTLPQPTTHTHTHTHMHTHAHVSHTRLKERKEDTTPMFGRKSGDDKRKRGKDKQKRSIDLNGKYSSKHLRQRATLLEERAVTQAAPGGKKRGK